MKILMVHNYYGSAAPSGENLVFDLETALLKERGHDVVCITRHSDSLKGFMGLMKGAISTSWSSLSAFEVKKIIDRFQPDIVHAHNTFPLLSPAIFPAARKSTRVLTLHNYRIFCPAAIPVRSGNICTECLDRKSVIPAMRYGCYRKSRAATVPLAASVALHRLRGTWKNDIEAFIVLTEFQRDLMVRSGLPRSKVWVKPNFYPGQPTPIHYAERSGSVVFAGRLSYEKGVGDLIEAWRRWGPKAPELRLIGDGPLRAQLEEQAIGLSKISFLGQVSAHDAQSEIANAKLLILPSRWFEGFPLVLREAFALGTPSLVSNLGPLPDLVNCGAGRTFEAGNIADLLEKSQSLLNDTELLSEMASAAYNAYVQNYSENNSYQQLMRIYDAAISIHKS